MKLIKGLLLGGLLVVVPLVSEAARYVMTDPDMNLGYYTFNQQLRRNDPASPSPLLFHYLTTDGLKAGGGSAVIVETNITPQNAPGGGKMFPLQSGGSYLRIKSYQYVLAYTQESPYGGFYYQGNPVTQDFTGLLGKTDNEIDAALDYADAHPDPSGNAIYNLNSETAAKSSGADAAQANTAAAAAAAAAKTKADEAAAAAIAAENGTGTAAAAASAKAAADAAAAASRAAKQAADAANSKAQLLNTNNGNDGIQSKLDITNAKLSSIDSKLGSSGGSSSASNAGVESRLDTTNGLLSDLKTELTGAPGASSLPDAVMPSLPSSGLPDGHASLVTFKEGTVNLLNQLPSVNNTIPTLIIPSGADYTFSFQMPLINRPVNINLSAHIGVIDSMRSMMQFVIGVIFFILLLNRLKGWFSDAS